MQPVNLAQHLAATRRLDIAAMTDDDEAMDAMRPLMECGPCTVGLANFLGQTPWEWHPDDEFLHVLDGTVAVDVLPPAGPVRTCTIGAGELFVVPARCWHRQHAATGTRLLFITSRDGNQVSHAADPRSAAEPAGDGRVPR